MQIQPPSPEEYASICSSQAFRFPEKAAVTVLGDRGAPVRLPFVFGNPSGACELPRGVKPSSAWSHTVAVTMKLAEPDPDGPARLVEDCVLWPPPPQWSTWVDRWPALPAALARPVRQKFAASLDLIVEPPLNEREPEAVRAALEQHPRAVWRILKPRGETVNAVIDPPDPITWRLFVEAMQSDEADRWALTLDVARASLVYLEEEQKGDVIRRWPGITMVVMATVGRLAGLSAETELGEW